MDDNSIMPWGKHKGEKMANVPASYLLWLYNSGDCSDPDVKKYITDNIETIRFEVMNESR